MPRARDDTKEFRLLFMLLILILSIILLILGVLGCGVKPESREAGIERGLMIFLDMYRNNQDFRRAFDHQCDIQAWEETRYTVGGEMRPIGVGDEWGNMVGRSRRR